MPEKDLSRDPCRTPMQWSNAMHAGFSTVEPWLRVDKRYPRYNVQQQRENPFSILNLYHELIALRNKEPALSRGTYTPIQSNDQYMAYQRDSSDGDSFFVMLNLSSRPWRYRQDPSQLRNGIVEISTSPELKGMAIREQIYLTGDEGIVARLSGVKQ